MFCANCGLPLLTDSLFCQSCGTRTISAAAAIPVLESAASASAAQGNAVTWPLYQQGWPSGIWMPLLAAIPLLGEVVSGGWSVSAVRRRAIGAPQLMPKFQDLGQVVVYGFVLTVFMRLYFELPLTVMGKLFHWTWENYWTGMLELALTHLLDFRSWQAVGESVADFNIKKLLLHVLDLVAPVLYCLFVFLPFYAAVVRYALHLKIRCFFQIWTNGLFVKKYLAEFFNFFILFYVIELAAILLAGMSKKSDDYSLVYLSIVWGSACWTRAYLLGVLARKIYESENAVTQPAVTV